MLRIPRLATLLAATLGLPACDAVPIEEAIEALVEAQARQAAAAAVPMLPAPPIDWVAHYGDATLPGYSRVAPAGLGRDVPRDLFGRALVLPDPAFLRAHLERSDWDALERDLAHLRSLVLHDARRELLWSDAFDAFEQSDPALGEALEAWVAARPDSAFARMARGAHHYQRGWHARGDGWARSVTDAQWAEMRSAFRLAAEDLVLAVQRDPQVSYAWQLLLSLARASSADELSDFAWQGGIAHHPASWYIRNQRMNDLLPRWGGSHEAMAAHCLESLEHVESHPALQTLCGYLAWDLACSYRREEDYATALALTRQALAWGENSSFRKLHARNVADLEGWEAAVPEYAALAARFPYDLEHRARLGDALARAGRIDAALPLLHQALADPEAEDTARDGIRHVAWRFWKQGDREHDAGDLEGALRHWKRSSEVDPGYPWPHYSMGRVKLEARRHAEAEAAFLRAVEADPAFVQAYENLAFLLGNSGRNRELLVHAERLLELRPDDPWGHEARGQMRLRLGDERGRDDLRIACEAERERACGMLRCLEGVMLAGGGGRGCHG